VKPGPWRTTLIYFAVFLVFIAIAGAAYKLDFLVHYKGKPFTDALHPAGEQKIPGRVECALYDVGGEGVAYHDTDAANHGSGELNPANGKYLNEFRKGEGVDTSYTKFKLDPQIDDNPYDLTVPPGNQLYVGWTEPGEWFNITVNVEKRALYTADLLYTANGGGTISLDVNGKPATGPITIPSTNNPADPLAWRQWHHWNTLPGVAKLKLWHGRNVLTVHVLSGGNMNLAYFDFRKAQ
jgi:hypothetical protein